jgi:hypothetical protein
MPVTLIPTLLILLALSPVFTICLDLAGPTAPVSIFSESAYIAAKECVTICLFYDGLYHPSHSISDDLGEAIGCGAGDPVNACYCRDDLASSASSYLTACVSSRCTGSKAGNINNEVASAVSMYNGYCATANSAAAAETTATDVSGNMVSTTSRPRSSSNIVGPAASPTASRDPIAVLH